MARSSSTLISLILSATALYHLITIVSVKLNLTNYLVWHMQILPLIESLKVKDLITEGLPAKKETDKECEADSEYEMYSETLKEKDLLLRSWITGTLSEEVLYLVVEPRKFGCVLRKIFSMPRRNAMFN